MIEHLAAHIQKDFVLELIAPRPRGENFFFQDIELIGRISGLTTDEEQAQSTPSSRCASEYHAGRLLP